MTEEDAEDKAETKLQDTYLKTFMTKYSCVLQYWMDLRHGSLHKQIVDSIDEYVSKGYDMEQSIRRVMKKHKHDLEAFIEEVDEEEDSDEEENQSGRGLPMGLILSVIPTLYQYRIKAILLHIMKDPRKILGLNHRGECVIENSKSEVTETTHQVLV
jgi:hypothetical protein